MVSEPAPGEGVLPAIPAFHHKEHTHLVPVPYLAHYYSPAHQREPQLGDIARSIDFFRHDTGGLVQDPVFWKMDVLCLAHRLWISPFETILLCDILANLVAALEEELLFHRQAVVVYAVIHDMDMRVVLLAVGGDNELGVLDVHPFHILRGYGQPEPRREFLPIFRRTGEDEVTHRLAYSRAKGRLESETEGKPLYVKDRVPVFILRNIHPFRAENLYYLFVSPVFIKYIPKRSGEAGTVANECIHIIIGVYSGSGPPGPGAGRGSRSLVLELLVLYRR